MTTDLQVPPPGEHFNFAHHLIERNAGRAGKTAFIDDTASITYAELAQRVRRFAETFVNLIAVHEELMSRGAPADLPGPRRRCRSSATCCGSILGG